MADLCIILVVGYITSEAQSKTHMSAFVVNFIGAIYTTISERLFKYVWNT